MSEYDAAGSQSRRPKGRTFSFNLSFGRKPPIDDPEFQALLDRAIADAVNSPDGRANATYSQAFDRATGESVPADDPRVQELAELARTEHPTLPDGTRMTVDSETFRLDFADGELRFGRGQPQQAASGEPPVEDPAAAREVEMWERLARIAEGKGAYPDTARWHARLSMLTWVIAIALPLAVLIGTIASGQSQETIFFMTFGATIVAAMFRSSIR
jgi:hypothetical protein